MMLPPPEPDALAHSAALARRIARAVDAAGGWMPFDRWMAHALYEPGLGYYAGPARPFGAGGDFVTAPELSPLFAECVAVQVADWFAHTEPVVLEFGAGTGRLAAGVLNALRALGTPARRYAIVEVSGSLRARQRDTLARLAPHALDAVEWLDALPDSIDGVVLANEVLDAMPVRVFEFAHGVLHEIGVEIEPGSPPDSPGYRWAARAADVGLHDAVAQALRAALPADAPAAADPFGPLGCGRYRSELGLQAQAWMGTVGRALRRGAMLLIDYGFPAREYYHPQRDGGTLLAHRRHRVHADVLRWPGLQDVTAHVDFSALARAAEAVGLETIGYLSQARFLLNCGLLDRLADATRDAPGGPRDVESVRALGAVQTLLSEAEMGELFKVVAFGRGMPTETVGFSQGERSASL